MVWQALIQAYAVEGGSSTDKAPDRSAAGPQCGRREGSVRCQVVRDRLVLNKTTTASCTAPPERNEGTPPTAGSARPPTFRQGWAANRTPASSLQHAHCTHINGAVFLRMVGLDDPAEGFEIVPTDADAPELLPAFDRKTNGKIKATRENLSLALTRSDWPRWQLRHDTFKDATMIAPHLTSGTRLATPTSLSCA